MHTRSMRFCALPQYKIIFLEASNSLYMEAVVFLQKYYAVHSGSSRGQCGVWFSISHSPHFSPHWTLFKVYKSTHHSCHCIAVWCNALLYSDMQSCMVCCVDLGCVSVWIFCVFSQWCAFYDAVKCLSLHAVWFSFIYLELANLMLPTDWRSLVLTHGGVVASTQKARNLLQIAGREMAYLLKFCTPFVLVYLVDLKW